MRIGKPAPDFKAVAVMPNREFGEICLTDYRGQWLVLFFYPLDFTLVCPTEIRGFNSAYSQFKAANTELIGCSVDSQFSHLNWIERDFKSLSFPLMSDITKEISEQYGVLLEDGFALRGTFIIDPNGIVRSILMNDTCVGRSIDETLRTLQALQTGELTGCGWKPGDATIRVPATT